MGIKAANFPKNKKMANMVSAWMMPATGVCPPFLILVAVRAIAPVAGSDGKRNKFDDIAQSCQTKYDKNDPCHDSGNAQTVITVFLNSDGQRKSNNTDNDPCKKILPECFERVSFPKNSQ
jgi:hypothetical protein